ncbi:hypothetical protein HY449_00305 [Candidatus Pacearchaeota archaeon]|nr:hypothetical protein [Candidatus Pacearchaeota archaeon]
MASIRQTLGKINPMLYAENCRELLAEYGTIDKIPADKVKPKPLQEHTLTYDSSSETLEPIYFFILDLMETRGMSPQKLIDNFASSPGSGHFGELGQRATIMQQQGTRILGDVNTVLRSVLNIIYDLREFRIRLEHYDNLKNKDKSVSDAAVLSLKQIWLDRVDINKGNSSVKAMAFQGGFQTLIHAFLAAKDENLKDDNGNEMDLNEVVKRILRPRIQEFNIWLKESERELRKRYELEKTYLRSQVSSLKLYSRWAKPYLKAAEQMEMKDMSRDAGLVKAFNTIIFELSLFGKNKIDVKGAALEKKLPVEFTEERFLKTVKRDYFSCTLVEFRFRGIPQRVGGQQSHYVFGGKADVTFSAYSLNGDEVAMFEQEVNRGDVEDILKLIEGVTTESLSQLQNDINFFLEEKENKKEDEKKTGEINPLLALTGYYDMPSSEREKIKTETFGKKMTGIFGFGGPNKEEKKAKEEIKFIRPENWTEEKLFRVLANQNAEEVTFDIFDIYKKGHGMPSYT